VTSLDVNRRRFLQLAGGTAALTLLPASIARAASIPAHRATGSIEDVEHVVILIQENRSFDHYFGTMRGVRGYADPHPAVLPSGKSVFHQSNGVVETLPFRPNVCDLGLAFVQDLDHSWNGSHQAFNAGRYDQWIPAKSTTTMAHLTRHDMPFHYALADAFTICDAYHCSLLGPTDPNRYYAWTGWVGNDGKGGGPVIANDEIGYSWTTYPERLEAAGVSWKIYQDAGAGLDAAHSWGWGSDAYIGNYGDNSLLYFTQYQNAKPGSPLYDNARIGTNSQRGQDFFDILTTDVKSGKLPQVSWIVAPEAFTEHPNWPANYGAWYVAKLLDALTSDPNVWAKTALFITYDENDGFFDHIVPPYASGTGLPGESTVDTANELYVTGDVNTKGGSTGVTSDYGLGVRVPMLVISPWSTGGWVCSETFDHTSMLRFLEQRFGVREPNITDWRRTVAGDLTSAFDFSRTSSAVPPLPSTSAYAPPDADRHPDYVPVPPIAGALPAQEKGTRPSRTLGYALEVQPLVVADRLDVSIHNNGHLGAQLQARSVSLAGAPYSYTVASGKSLTVSWPVLGAYDVSLHGPNGFFRRLAGTTLVPHLEAFLITGRGGELLLEVANSSRTGEKITLADAYGRHSAHSVSPRGTVRVPVTTRNTGGWYDLTVTGAHGLIRQLAGRVETVAHPTSDPQLGR
jgi:phospholipase C